MIAIPFVNICAMQILCYRFIFWFVFFSVQINGWLMSNINCLEEFSRTKLFNHIEFFVDHSAQSQLLESWIANSITRINRQNKLFKFFYLFFDVRLCKSPVPTFTNSFRYSKQSRSKHFIIPTWNVQIAKPDWRWWG